MDIEYEQAEWSPWDGVKDVDIFHALNSPGFGATREQKDQFQINVENWIDFLIGLPKGEIAAIIDAIDAVIDMI